MADLPDNAFTRLAEALSPYLHTRQETLRIRRLLTLHLASQITSGSGNDSSHSLQQKVPSSYLALSSPDFVTSDTRVDRIPAEFSGLRRKYLEAVRANAAAKKSLEDAQKEALELSLYITRNGGDDQIQKEQGRSASKKNLDTHVAVLRQRRELEKLQVFQDTLDQLDRMEAARPGFLDLQAIKGKAPDLPAIIVQKEMGHGNALGGNGGALLAENLLVKLEKTVVQAKSKLEKERKLLEELKSKTKDQPVDKETRVAALSSVRDELVSWVEEQLSKSGSGSVDDVHLQELEEQQRTADAERHMLQSKARIESQYAAYLQARERLLDMAAVVTTLPQAGSAQTIKPLVSVAKKLDVSDPTMANANTAQDLLNYTTTHLLPLLKLQKALAVQKTYLNSSLARSRESTLQTLSRLSDESHLLPSYPMLAHQPRFQHAVAALESRGGREHTGETTDPVLRQAQAWAFASDGARTVTKQSVEEKTLEGLESIDAAQEGLSELYSLLKQDYLGDAAHGVEDLKEGSADADEDIWAEEINRKTKQKKEKDKGKGPWAGLNGKVGVIGDV